MGIKEGTWEHGEKAVAEAKVAVDGDLNNHLYYYYYYE